uniref:Uncharacterized protein n=1 Tax=Oryza meridionalis TaxID=40149 RepID=A0A0E0CFW1_9ORYZ
MAGVLPGRENKLTHHLPYLQVAVWHRPPPTRPFFQFTGVCRRLLPTRQEPDGGGNPEELVAEVDLLERKAATLDRVLNEQCDEIQKPNAEASGCYVEGEGTATKVMKECVQQLRNAKNRRILDKDIIIVFMKSPSKKKKEAVLVLVPLASAIAAAQFSLATVVIYFPGARGNRKQFRRWAWGCFHPVPGHASNTGSHIEASWTYTGRMARVVHPVDDFFFKSPSKKKKEAVLVLVPLASAIAAAQFSLATVVIYFPGARGNRKQFRRWAWGCFHPVPGHASNTGSHIEASWTYTGRMARVVHPVDDFFFVLLYS